MMNINLLQWNCRSMHRRSPELTFLLDKYNINIATLCETRLEEHFRPIVNNFDIHSYDRNRYGGGVAILIDRRLRFTQITDDNINLICSRNNIEFIFGKVWLGMDKFVYVCSLYSPRSGNYSYTESCAWYSIFQYLSSFNPTVVCGDMNGKSALWSPDLLGPDTEGRKLENAVSSLDFSCLNDGNYTWASADLSSTSALDIMLVSPSIAPRCSWSVLENNYGSDHFPIIVSIINNNTMPSFGSPSFAMSRVDWSKFQLECSKFANQTHNFGINLDVVYDNLINFIHHALLMQGI